MLECAWECRVQTGSRGGPALASCRVSIAVATVMAGRQAGLSLLSTETLVQGDSDKLVAETVKLFCVKIYE